MQNSKQTKKKPNSAAAVALRRKMVLLIASFALLVALVVAGTAAWYTRVSEVSGMTMDVASFDFTADFVTSTFLIKAEDYLDTDKKIAPGSYGVIPINLSATDSSVPVNYALNFDFSTMAPEFRERICFYYYKAKDDGSYERIYLTNGCEDLQGRIEPHTTNQHEYICWKWMYELTPDLYYTTTAALDGQAGVWNVNDPEHFTSYAAIHASDETTATAIREHDELDTKIGLGQLDDEFVSSNGTIYYAAGSTISAIQNGLDDDPDLGTYTTLSAIQKAMEFKIVVSGVGAKAETDSSVSAWTSHSTSTVPAFYYKEIGNPASEAD